MANEGLLEGSADALALEASVGAILRAGRDGSGPEAVAGVVADEAGALLGARASLGGEGNERGSDDDPARLRLELGEGAGVIELWRRGRAFSARERAVGRMLGEVGSSAVRNAELRGEVDRANLDVIFRLATAAEFRDGETGGHIQRVSLYAESVASRMGVGRELSRRLLFAAPMHDVGKLGVPDSVLLKPGPLTDGERAQMQRHTVMGGEVLADSTNPILVMGREIALSHHERWDGRGYPEGLRGQAIPLSARIVAIGDVFDALTSKRVYKEAISIDDAMGLIEAEIGSHFDPEVGRAFLAASETIARIRGAYAELAETGGDARCVSSVGMGVVRPPGPSMGMSD